MWVAVTPTTAVGRIQRTLDDVKAVRCVVWVNVTEWTNFFGYDTRRGGPVFNRGLLDAATMDDRLHVVDYAGLFRPDTPKKPEAYLRELRCAAPASGIARCGGAMGHPGG